MSAPLTDRLAVCSWSLQPATPAELLDRLAEIGIRRVQLALDPLRESPEVWGGIGDLCRERGITIVSGMFGTLGEDYTTLETIRLTGGVVPDATWETNLTKITAAAGIAGSLGLRLVSFHAGFLPHEESDPDYHKLRDRLVKLAGIFDRLGIHLVLETGQETAATLREFLDGLGCANVGVNFDPANMVLYGKGDPIEAMRTLGPWIRQVHLKDAKAANVPGTWGEEVPAGSGEVDWPAFFATLDELGFAGDICIEREAGNQRTADILTAKRMVGSLSI
ncbi:MAG: TIM barrel protein [Verrucomicrobia bacterium]|nr:TIM barrel protein [Verrucomicrobiota bacterium]